MTSQLTPTRRTGRPWLVDHQRRARGQPAPAAVGQADPELVGGSQRGALGAGAGIEHARQVVGMDHRHPLLAVRRGLRRRRPRRWNICSSQRSGEPSSARLPRADAGVAGDQRRALAGVAQRLERGVLLGHVDDHAEDAPPLDRRRVDVGTHHHPADAAVAAQDAELDLLPSAPTASGRHGSRCPTRSRSSGWTHSLSHSGRLGTRGGAKRSKMAKVCSFQSVSRRIDRGRPHADAGGVRCGLEPARQLLGLAAAARPARSRRGRRRRRRAARRPRRARPPGASSRSGSCRRARR